MISSELDPLLAVIPRSSCLVRVLRDREIFYLQDLRLVAWMEKVHHLRQLRFQARHSADELGERIELKFARFDLGEFDWRHTLEGSFSLDRDQWLLVMARGIGFRLPPLVLLWHDACFGA